MREREAWPELSDRDPKCQDPVTAGPGVWGPEHAESDERRARSGGSGARRDFYTEIAEDCWHLSLLVVKGLTFLGRSAAVNQDGF
jgi:hypothetical protein